MAGTLNAEKWRRYIYQAATLPPLVTLRKMQRKVITGWQRNVRRQQACWFGTKISDAAFFRALQLELPTQQAWLKHLDARTTPQFFLHPDRRHEFVATLRAEYPEAEKTIIAAADQICAHIFDLLGSGPTQLGANIDWHRDFKSEYRWNPQQYYTDIRAADFPGGHDLKTPWELNRCQHFIWLGQAYWLTENEIYAREFTAQVTDWIEQNPPQFGVNWACTMDVALRAINWLWGYHFFSHAPSITPEFRIAFFKMLLAHGRHILDNLEWSETLTSNHYLSNITGLAYLGMLLPEFEEAQHWRTFGFQELEKEMHKQVYEDGVNFEASVAYHRLATELFLSPVLLAHHNGYRFSPTFLARLEKMLELIMAMSRSDGTVPQIGDNDNGRIHRLKVWAGADREWCDFRYLLAIGAVFFAREDFGMAAGDQWEEAIWLFGNQARFYKAKADAATPASYMTTSTAFATGGLYIMRHSNMHMAVDAGSNGQNGNGGHAHNDALSFELYACGQAWIVDPGTYLYTADYEARNLFRSTAYHNTVQVDGQELCPFSRYTLFRLNVDVHPTVHRWESTSAYDFLDVSHRAYARLAHPVVHRRQVYFDKQVRLWLIRDEIDGEDRHNLTWRWHFAPALDLSVEDNQVIARASHARFLQMWCVDRRAPELSIENGWVSPSYGRRVAASLISYSCTATLPVTLTMAFIVNSHELEFTEESSQTALTRFATLFDS